MEARRDETMEYYNIVGRVTETFCGEVQEDRERKSQLEARSMSRCGKKKQNSAALAVLFL